MSHIFEDEVSNTELSDEETIRKRNKKLKNRLKQADLDLEAIMADTKGRSVIGRILSIRGPYSISMTDSPYTTAFNEGLRRYSCIIIEDLLRVCPELYLLLQKESLNKQKENDSE